MQVGGYAQKDLSAKKKEEAKNSRFSGEDANLRRKAGNCPEEEERKEAPRRVTWKELFLRKSSEIEQIALKGRRKYEEWGWIGVLSTQKTHSRLAVIVGKKSGNAVKRNRFRRKVKTWFYQNWQCVKGGNDVMLVVRVPVDSLDEKDLPERLQRIFQNVGLWQC